MWGLIDTQKLSETEKGIEQLIFVIEFTDLKQPSS